MKISLTSRDLQRLRGVQEALLSPMEFPDSGAWRREVNRRVRGLTGADKVVFFVPGHGAYSDEIDPAAHVEYDAYYHRLDRGAEIALGRRLLVASHPQLYDYPTFLRGEWYNDFLARNGCFQTLGLTVGLSGGVPPLSFLSLQRERPSAAPFDRRVRTQLELLAPAFRAGVETALGRETWRDALEGALDRVAERLSVYRRSGRPLHRNRALRETLDREPERRSVLQSMESAARAVAEPGNGSAPERSVRTARGSYRIRATRVAEGCAGPVVVVTLEPQFRVPIADDELVEDFGLTPREIQVARRVAVGEPNRAIAEGLGISPHTVRRHTEAVMRKLDVTSRAQVVERITR